MCLNLSTFFCYFYPFLLLASHFDSFVWCVLSFFRSFGLPVYDENFIVWMPVNCHGRHTTIAAEISSVAITSSNKMFQSEDGI